MTRTSQPASLGGPGFGSDRSGLWTMEGYVLIALGLLALTARMALSIGVDEFLGWIYAFVGGVRIFSGAVHRGPGVGWILLSALIAVMAGVMLVLRPFGEDLSLGAILATYFLGEAVAAFGLANTAGVRLACASWMSWVAVADILLAALAVTAADYGRHSSVTFFTAINLGLNGVTMLLLGHRWESHDMLPSRRPRVGRSGAATYPRPWSRHWRRD